MMKYNTLWLFLSNNTIHVSVLKNVLVYAAVLLLCDSCKNYAVSTKDNPHCQTRISGNVYSGLIWYGQYPAIMLKEDGEAKIYYGTINAIKRDGVIFARKLNGRYNKPEKFFPYSDILFLINKDCELVYGSIPKEKALIWGVDFEVTPINDSTSRGLTISLEPNKPFSFCMEPGDYRIRRAHFILTSDFNDHANQLPDLTFSVKPNTDNFIGNIYVDSVVAGSSPMVIPCDIGERPSDAVAYMFGAIGGAIHGLSKSLKSAEHSITITNALKPPAATESIITKAKKQP